MVASLVDVLKANPIYKVHANLIIKLEPYTATHKFQENNEPAVQTTNQIKPYSLRFIATENSKNLN